MRRKKMPSLQGAKRKPRKAKAKKPMKRKRPSFKVRSNNRIDFDVMKAAKVRELVEEAQKVKQKIEVQSHLIRTLEEEVEQCENKDGMLLHQKQTNDLQRHGAKVQCERICGERHEHNDYLGKIRKALEKLGADEHVSQV